MLREIFSDNIINFYYLEYSCYYVKFLLAMNIDVKKLRIGNIHQPCFCVFDIIFYNNKVLTSQPLNKRLDILKNVFEPIDGIFVQVARNIAKK